MGILSFGRKKRAADNLGMPHQLTIEPPKGWQLINWRELVAYRDLFYFLVQRDVKVLYKQTVLGFAWAVIRPVFSMVIFTIIFGNLANVSSDGVPYAVFNYVALVPWLYFSGSMNDAAMSLVGNTGMLTKVYFPRLVFPMTGVIAKLVDFAIASVITGALMLWYRVAPTWSIVYLPLLVLLMMLTAAGIGMWLAALAVQFRDIKHAMPFVTQVMMYAAPVVWPVSLIEERYGPIARLFYGLYPMAGVIEGFRAALLGTQPMPWDLIGMGSVAAIIVFVAGLFYFKRMEYLFADVA
ncbi:MAG: ABC transporter permease [Anaerolineales bacterium]|nr:ABC transporter permease [Anaerolineales bacterium]